MYPAHSPRFFLTLMVGIAFTMTVAHALAVLVNR